MKAMILAAGKGTRMLPLTETIPKPLLHAGEHRLIEWQILRLKRAGIRDIVINHYYLGEQFETVLGDGSRFGVALSYSPETEVLDTAGGIVQALPLLTDDCFILTNGDVWTDFPFQRLLQHARLPGWDLQGDAEEGANGDSKVAAPMGIAQREAQRQTRPLAHLVLIADAPHHPQGDFYLLDSGHVTDRWPDAEQGSATTPAPRRLTYAGIALLRRDLFAGLSPSPRALAPLLRQAMRSRQVTGELYEGDWRDIGTPERLAELERTLL